MAAVNHVDSFKNPYHYSFSLCASGNFLPTGNYNEDKSFPSSNKTYYSYEANYDPKPLFSCDLCDRGFKTDAQYKRHVSEHVTCGKDGCEFTAHPKVVAVHYRSQHETGVFHLIKKLNAPEEVKKWIEERKRKYPTKQNIQNQKLVEEDKIRRGEIIKPDNGRFNKKFGQRRERGCPQNKSNKQPKPNHNVKKNKPKAHVTPKSETAVLMKKDEVRDDSNGGVPAFQGLGGGKKEVKAITEDTSKLQIPPVKKDPSLLVNKSLALLMTSYDSETDEDQPSVPAPTLQANSDSDSAPEEVQTIKSSAPHEIQIECSNRKRKLKRNNRQCPKRRKTGKVIQQTRPRKQTLLEKLLHDQVVNERQLILSSIRCIVKNNFFETGNKKQETVLPKKSSLLEGLLKDEIIRERNMILQCIRQIVNNNFFESHK